MTLKKTGLQIIFLLSTRIAIGQVVDQAMPINRHTKLYVAFDANFTFDASISYGNQAATAIPELKSIQEQYNFELKKGIPISDAKWYKLNSGSNGLVLISSNLKTNKYNQNANNLATRNGFCPMVT